MKGYRLYDGRLRRAKGQPSGGGTSIAGSHDWSVSRISNVTR